MKTTKWLKIILLGCVGIYACVSLYPLIWMVFQSLKTDLEFFQNQYLPSPVPQWINYATAWGKANFALYYQNSILVTGISLGLIVFTCSLAGYAFARINFYGKKILQLLLVVVLFLPSPMLLFPVYLICRSLHIVNTYIGLIGPYVCGQIPLGILILTSAFEGIPQEIAEAAKIDGCSEYGTWWRIMFPLVRPAVATIAILAFLNIWNEYMWALISINSQNLFTLPIGIVNIASKIFIYGYGAVFAGLVMTTLPVLIFYIAFQDQFVKSIAAGAVKG